MLDEEAIISQSFETSLNFETIMAACAQPDERKALVLDSHPSQSQSYAGFGSLSQEYNLMVDQVLRGIIQVICQLQIMNH